MRNHNNWQGSYVEGMIGRFEGKTPEIDSIPEEEAEYRGNLRTVQVRKRVDTYPPKSKLKKLADFWRPKA